MDHSISTRLTHVFDEHNSHIRQAAERRESRDEEAKRSDSAFHLQFETHLTGAVLPLLEEVGAAVRANGHECEVTRATHGDFFSGANDAPGAVFMFYPAGVPESKRTLSPRSSYVAVFAEPSQHKVQLHTQAVQPGGFRPGRPPTWLSIEEVNSELLTSTCIDVIEETMHCMEK